MYLWCGGFEHPSVWSFTGRIYRFVTFYNGASFVPKSSADSLRGENGPNVRLVLTWYLAFGASTKLGHHQLVERK
jgi:hypothetical protein